MFAGLQPFRSRNWQAIPDPFMLFHSGKIKIHPILYANSFSLLLPPCSSCLKHSSHILSSSLTPDLPSLSHPHLLFSPFSSREPCIEAAGPPRRGPINRPWFSVMMPLLMSVQLLQYWIGRINVGSSTSASLFHCHSLLSCLVDRGGKRSPWIYLSI